MIEQLTVDFDFTNNMTLFENTSDHKSLQVEKIDVNVSHEIQMTNKKKKRSATRLS